VHLWRCSRLAAAVDEQNGRKPAGGDAARQTQMAMQGEKSKLRLQPLELLFSPDFTAA